MATILIHTNTSGNTTITIPVETPIEKLIPKDGEYLIVDENTLQHYGFLDTAKVINGTIVYDISKAKEIQKNEFRAARKPILEKLDIQYMRADEQGDTTLKQQIAAQKQELRDVTNTPLPDDLEGIKNTWPSILDL